MIFDREKQYDVFLIINIAKLYNPKIKNEERVKQEKIRDDIKSYKDLYVI